MQAWQVYIFFRRRDQLFFKLAVLFSSLCVMNEVYKSTVEGDGAGEGAAPGAASKGGGNYRRQRF
jgi:hypothetical protein